MLGVRGHLGQSPVLDSRQDATSGHTHRTVGVNLLDGHGDALTSLQVQSARTAVVDVRSDGLDASPLETRGGLHACF